MSDGVAIALIGMATAIVVAIITALVSVATLLQGRSTHRLVNGMHTELVTAEKGQSHAEGVLQGESDQRDRTASHAPMEVVGVADPTAEPIRTIPVEKP